MIGKRIDAVIDAALGGRIVGCVILVRQSGREVYARAAGLADREADRPMREDAIFRLASVTKPSLWIRIPSTVASARPR